MKKITLHENIDFKHSKYIAQIAMCFYTIIIAASIAGQKIISIMEFVISAGTLIFPISYMLISCITELYGLKKAKQIIFTGALCNIFISLYLYLVIKIPQVSFWENQEPFSKINYTTSKILLTSTFAYLASEYINAFVISKLKFLLKGRWLLGRAITSTSIATIADSIFMLPIIFHNTPNAVLKIFISLIFFKITYEILLLPVLWIIVELLKKKEFINNTDLIPFSSVSHQLNVYSIKNKS